MGNSVLIVDDEPAILSSLGRILKARGSVINVASSGEEAVEKARDLKPNMILMDMRMPGISGLEALHRIKKFQNDAYVVLMTGFSEQMTQAEAEGIHVMTKPIDPACICELVRQAN